MQTIKGLLSIYKFIEHKMLLNYSLYSHLNFFPRNFGAVRDEHGERFHEVTSTMKKQYQCKWGPSMLTDYCWTSVRDDPALRYNHKSSVTAI
jgi:hypothetical protein